jgi:hypothetical protein
VLVLLALHVELPGGVDNVAPRGRPPILVSRVVTVLGYLGLGAAGAALVIAGTETSARWGRAALIGVGLIGAGLGGSLIELGGLVATYNKLTIGRDLFATGAATVVRVLGVMAIAASVAISAAPRAWLGQWRRVAIAAAATPFACGLGAYVYLRVAANGEVPAALGVPHPQGLAAQALVALVAGAGFVVGALLLWQTVVGVRASRDIGVGVGHAALRWPSLVFLLLGVKVAWLALGYLDILPGWLGGRLESWDATRGDDWLSWLIVAGLAATVALLLLRREPPDKRSEEEPTAAAAAAAGGLMLFLLAGTMAIFIVAILGVTPGSGVRRAVRDAGDWFADGLLTSQIVVVYVAGAASALLIVTRRWLTGAAVLMLFFIWSLPRAIDITINGANGPPNTLGRAELATLDTAITVALLIVAGAWALRPQEGARAAAIAVVLAASTALVYAGQLLGGVWAAGAFYIGLVFPAAYRFAFDAKSLNRRRPDRDARILAVTGLTAAFLVIAVVQTSSGFLGPDSVGTGALGRLLLAPPFAAVLVAISLRGASAQRPAVESPTGPHPTSTMPRSSEAAAP